MEHQSHGQLAHIAKLYKGNLPGRPMSRRERLDRWRKLLAQQPRRVLHTLHETEYWPRRTRDDLRNENTAITVAFEDVVLREEGLRGDSYGDARRFFGLSDSQLHFVVCYCHSGANMPAGSAARRLEFLLPSIERVNWFQRVLRRVTGSEAPLG